MSDTLNFVLAHPNDAADRIEALEAALREIKDYLGYARNNDKSSAQIADNAHSAWRVARAALAPEQGT